MPYPFEASISAKIFGRN